MPPTLVQRGLALLALLFAMSNTLPQTTTPATTEPDDPFLWLEEVQGDRALAWVRERNA